MFCLFKGFLFKQALIKSSASLLILFSGINNSVFKHLATKSPLLGSSREKFL